MNKSKLIITLTILVCISVIIVTIYKLGDGTIYNKYKCPDTTYKLENRRCKKHDVKRINEKLTCKTGYEVVGGTCQKVTKVASKVYYSCDKGYTLEDQSCVKKMNSGLVTKYKCYTGKQSKTDASKCEKYSVPSVKTVGTDKVKYCTEEQGTLVGDNCIKTVNATATKGCADGYTKLNSTTCQKKIVETPKINRTCDKGYTLEDIKCVKREVISGTYEKVCEDGYTMKDGKCHKDIDIVATKDSLF